MSAVAQRVCPLCGRTIGDRTRTKCPNFKKHVSACEKAKRAEEIKKLEASMARFDEADPRTVDASEYGRMLHRLVQLRTAERLAAEEGGEVMLTLDDINLKIEDLESERRQWLRRHGWTYTSNTPGSLWLWEKKLDDGRTVLVDEKSALVIADIMDIMATTTPATPVT